MQTHNGGSVTNWYKTLEESIPKVSLRVGRTQAYINPISAPYDRCETQSYNLQLDRNTHVREESKKTLNSTSARTNGTGAIEKEEGLNPAPKTPLINPNSGPKSLEWGG